MNITEREVRIQLRDLVGFVPAVLVRDRESFTRMPVPSMVGAPSLCSESRTMLIDVCSCSLGNKNVVGLRTDWGLYTRT